MGLMDFSYFLLRILYFRDFFFLAFIPLAIQDACDSAAF